MKKHLRDADGMHSNLAKLTPAKCKSDGAGKVILENRNIMSSGCIKGLYEHPKHMTEPYDRVKELRRVRKISCTKY